MWVYLLQSDRYPGERYMGHTTNVERRISQHDAGDHPATAPYRPWRLVAAIAFADDLRALAFEKYLKSGSGRAFANKRLWA